MAGSSLDGMLSKKVIGYTELLLETQMRQGDWRTYGDQAQILTNRQISVIACGGLFKSRKSDPVIHSVARFESWLFSGFCHLCAVGFLGLQLVPHLIKLNKVSVLVLRWVK